MALSALALASQAEAQLAPGPRPLRACILEPASLTPLFKPAKAPVAPDVGSDDEDEDDEDEEDEDEVDAEDDDEETVRGYLLPDGVTCLGLGGSVYAGVQGDWLARGRRKVLSLRNQDVSSFPHGATLKLDTLQPAGDNLMLGAGVTLAFRSGSDPAIERAVITLGGFAAGLDSSRFNFWDGANFASSARVPARQAHQLAYDIGLTETSRVGLSAEFPVPVPSSLPPPQNQPGLRAPDLVARYLYEGDHGSVQIAGSLHEIRQTFSGPPRIGRAAMLGVMRDVALGGVTHTLSAQVAGTLGAPVYIGSQLDGLLARSLVNSRDLPWGYSAVGSISSVWTPHWSTNAYISLYDLRTPARTATGRIEVTRVVANLVWSPEPATRLTLEAGVAQTVVDLPGRVIAVDLSGRRTTVQMVIERKF